MLFDRLVGDRLMVGHCTLDARIGVRIPVPQPRKWPSARRVGGQLCVLDRDENAAANEGERGGVDGILSRELPVTESLSSSPSTILKLPI
jgi:hypothetical protein